MAELNIKTICRDLSLMTERQRQAAYAEAGAIIRRGGLVVFPTETVYGLGADAMNEAAVRSIFRAKGRPSDNPLIIHVADRDLSQVAAQIPEEARRLMAQFWPGPLTIILKKAPAVPDITTGGLDSVGVRMPELAAARDFIAASGRFIAAPSANISGRPSPTTYQRCREDLMGRVDMILGLDQSPLGLESTIIDLSGRVPELLRPGAITLEMLRDSLGEVLYRPQELLGEDEAPRAPGMKYRHYAPRARVVIYRGEREAVRARMLREKGAKTLLVFINGGEGAVPAQGQQRSAQGQPLATQAQPLFAQAQPQFAQAQPLAEEAQQLAGLVQYKDLAEAAHEIFETLRQADDDGYTEILIEAVPEQGLGLSLMNRVKKAAAYDIVEVN